MAYVRLHPRALSERVIAAAVFYSACVEKHGIGSPEATAALAALTDRADHYYWVLYPNRVVDGIEIPRTEPVCDLDAMMRRAEIAKDYDARLLRARGY